MTDHKKEAESILSSDLGSNPSATATTQAIVAVAAATLYLAEQQQIANLIALLPRLDNTVTVDRMDWDRPMPTERDTALAEIRTGLGLA